ncbi:MAG: hypothetical protein HY925_03125 [Elusimicrobia bacterium]|nr:hypothetical protein [Elusimicrobiota bacterium]
MKGILLAALLLPAGAFADEKLTGIAADGIYYRLDADTVCMPLKVGAGGAVTGWPECQIISKKGQKKMAFQPPKKGKFEAKIVKDKLTLLAGGKVVAVWNGHPEVIAAEDAYASADGKTAVIVYDYHSKERATVVMAHVGFRLK